MTTAFPLNLTLSDGTHVVVKDAGDGSYDLHLTRLNSEKHNFIWRPGPGKGLIEEAYESRFDRLQEEAIKLLREKLEE
ncbi:MAG TPA: hypothetical protein VHK69_06395 [Chitinophagaceae bacterium]|jgi:hypothetical protein|nr:hypothetical protein [Chitinophagaceae bacterium]